MGDLEEGRHRSRAAADRASLVAVLRSQAEAILACDFFTADQFDGTQAYVLSLLEHASRCIRIPGVTLHPTEEWTAQHTYEIHHNQHRPHCSWTQPRH